MKNIVAACQSYKMAETQNGDPYFSLTAIVKDPEEMVGRRATFMWFINDSEYASVEDNLDQLSNDLQLLGLEMPEDVADVVDLLAELCEKGVHLLFNTGSVKKSGKSPSLFVQGLADDYPDEPQEGAGEAAERPARSAARSAVGKGKPKDEPAADAQANDGGGDSGNAGDTPADDTLWEPTKGDIYGYTPPKSKNVIKVEVVSVDKKKKTFDLKGGKPPKVFKAVKWWLDKEETEASVATWED